MILMMMIMLQYNNCQASRQRMEKRYRCSLYLIPLKTFYAYENYPHTIFRRQVNDQHGDITSLFYYKKLESSNNQYHFHANVL